MSITIALAGNPNSGKTTLFNALTGSSQRVGNWPGVTVEHKEGTLKGYADTIITDLPGIYSLSPYTLEEIVSRDYLLNTRPDVIINLVDATNLERNLYLTTQLLELGIPIVIALNMMDIIRKRGDDIDLPALEKRFGCPVFEISALKNTGIAPLCDTAVALAHGGNAQTVPQIYGHEMENTLLEIAQLVKNLVPTRQLRWYAVKLFEKDEKVLQELEGQFDRHALNALIAPAETQHDDDSEAIITNKRYLFITQALRGVITRVSHGDTTSEKIDRVVTSRIFSLPIFVAVMFSIYYLAIVTVGSWTTDWANDVLFGEIVPRFTQMILNAIGAGAVVQSLVLDGVVGGVGAILGFLPQMLVLFFLLALLEDVGYMARVAFIMDRLFRHFGLSGKSFIPMLIGTGCSVPAIMASRTIEQDRDRKMTIITTSFIPCGAKMLMIGLFAGVIFENSAIMSTISFFIGVAAVIISGIILKKTKAFAGKPAPFVMELPPYHMPSVESVLRTTAERGISFVKKAGSIILLGSIFIWFSSSFGFVNGSFGLVESIDHSILGRLGSALLVIFLPIGFTAWEQVVASLMGLVAKEEIVAVFGTILGLSADLLSDTAAGISAIRVYFTPLTALSFMVFNLLCAPCFAAMGAIKREMNSWRWTAFAIGWMTALAYGSAFVVFQLGAVLTGAASFGIGTVLALLLVAVFLWALLRRGHRDDES